MIREIIKNGKRVGFDVQVSAKHPKTGARKDVALLQSGKQMSLSSNFVKSSMQSSMESRYLLLASYSLDTRKTLS